MHSLSPSCFGKRQLRKRSTLSEARCTVLSPTSISSGFRAGIPGVASVSLGAAILLPADLQALGGSDCAVISPQSRRCIPSACAPPVQPLTALLPCFEYAIRLKEGSVFPKTLAGVPSFFRSVTTCNDSLFRAPLRFPCSPCECH